MARVGLLRDSLRVAGGSEQEANSQPAACEFLTPAPSLWNVSRLTVYCGRRIDSRTDVSKSEIRRRRIHYPMKSNLFPGTKSSFLARHQQSVCFVRASKSMSFRSPSGRSRSVLEPWVAGLRLHLRVREHTCSC